MTSSKTATDPNLYWARKVNDLDNIGLYGPTLKRKGPVAECETLVAQGLMRAVRSGSVHKMGYWITDAGRKALAGEKADG